MIVIHKIALEPNNVQATYFIRAAGAARFAYNWALEQWKKQYQAWKSDHSLPRPSFYTLNRQFNAIKREQFPWMLEVTKCAPQIAIMHLERAFKNFLAGRRRYPKFRKKGRDDRFSISGDKLSIDWCRIRIPKLGWVRMLEPLRFTGRIISATISRVANRWFVSIIVDTPYNPYQPTAESQGVVGVDLGVSAFATLSTGEKIPGPMPGRKLLGRLRKLSRKLSRKAKGSSNREKARARLAKLHAHIAAISLDFLHKLTTDLTRRYHTIVIEDLNVSGMLGNRNLARYIVDMGFGTFRRQLQYKAAMRGWRVIVADRFFASSKTCSECGYKLEDLPLSIRKWACPSCSVVHDRDVNAAKNLERLALTTASSAESNACGEDGSGLTPAREVKLTSTKQEVSFVSADAGASKPDGTDTRLPILGFVNQ